MNMNTETISFIKNINGALIFVQDKTIVYNTDDNNKYIDEESRTYNVRTLNPDSDISGEPQEVQDICNAVWSDEVKAAWAEFQAADSE